MTFWIPDQSPDNPNAFSLSVSPACCVGPPDKQFYMGGVGFGTAIEALERATDKPLLWANIQFLTQTLSGATVDIDIDIPVNGRNVAQAIATVSDGERILHRTAAGLGGRDMKATAQFVSMPDVPVPDDCPSKDTDHFVQQDNLLTQFERTYPRGKWTKRVLNISGCVRWAAFR